MREIFSKAAIIKINLDTKFGEMKPQYVYDMQWVQLKIATYLGGN
jgi:hypothetical protein